MTRAIALDGIQPNVEPVEKPKPKRAKKPKSKANCSWPAPTYSKSSGPVNWSALRDSELRQRVMAAAQLVTAESATMPTVVRLGKSERAELEQVLAEGCGFYHPLTGPGSIPVRLAGLNVVFCDKDSWLEVL